MFHQFYDNNFHSFLLGKIESYSTKTIGKRLHYLILIIDNQKVWLEYTEYDNLISDIEALHNNLNDYYERVMEAETGRRENVMGYETCGDGVGTECHDYEEEPEEDKLVGFKIPKKPIISGPCTPIC